MADNSKEIKSLLKLRQQRPAFSRMISWEISQCDTQQPVKKTKQKKKQALKVPGNEEDNDENEVTTIDSESADSSEYETANEDTEVDLGPSTLTNSASFDYEDLCLISDEVAHDDIIDGEEDDDELMVSCKSGRSVTDDSSVEIHQERRRRPSKKQKRKRKRYFKVTYLDELYHLGNLFDPLDNIEDVFTEVSENGTDVAVHFRVPTLVELCLIASRKRRRSNSTKSKSSQIQIELSPNASDQNQQIDPKSSQPELKLTLPIGLKKMIAGRYQGKTVIHNQLSFFLNKVLPVLEESLTDTGFYSYSLKTFYYTTSAFGPGVRSVWNVLPYPWINDVNVPSYGCEKGTAFLVALSMCRCPEAENYGYEYTNGYDIVHTLLISTMSALANTVDLMLPSEVCTTAIIRVKRALGLRYKKLVDTHFENVLPYVMWSRGIVSMATDLFKTLIEKSEDYITKSMYLSEVAKMHAMFGDTKTAVQFYRLTTETACEAIKSGNRDHSVDEITEQEQILLASVHDIGVLDKEKSYQSNSYWSYVLSRGNSKTETIMAGVDAYLCYHLYNWNESKKYDEAIQKLEKLVKTHDFFNYYLSMLYALQGREDMSTKLYRLCRFGILGAPADLILSYMGSKARNPWQPVLDLVIKQRSAISPLKVIWRTNLQSPRLIKQRATEGQFSSQNLDLRLNDMGQLTGNLQMLLPPIRNVVFDPFTGSVIVDRFSNTGMWTSAYLDFKLYQSRNLMVPTPVMIYAGENGTTVELVNPAVVMMYNRNHHSCVKDIPPCPLILYWRDCNGQVAKLNVFTEVKNHIKEKIKKSIKQNEEKYCQGSDALLKNEYELLFKIVDKAADKNLALFLPNIDATVRKIATERKNEEKKKAGAAKSHKRDKKNKKNTFFRHFVKPASNNKYLNVQLDCEPFVFGSTVLLNLDIESGSSNGHILLFVDTSDKTSFLQYHLVDVTSNIVYDCVRNNCSDEEFVMLVTQGNGYVEVYNETGVKVDSILVKETLGSHNERLDILIIDQFIYGITKERTSIWKVHVGCVETDEGFFVENYIHWSVESISDLWQELIKDSNDPPELLRMEYVGKNFGEGIGKLLMLNLGAGLAFLDPQTMEFVSVNVPDIYSKHHDFTSNGQLMKGKFQTCKILKEKSYNTGNSFTTWTAIGVQHKIFVLETSHEATDRTVRLSMICSLILPGVAKDVCFIGKQAGMLISLTQQTDDDQRYREHVFQYDFNGRLCGVLPFLDASPRSFFTQYFHDNKNSDSENVTGTQSLKGWHAYMRDGRDGILCVELNH